MEVYSEPPCMLAQSFLTFCNLMDCSLSVPSVHEISQARTLEWVVISFFKGSSWPRGQTHVSCISCITGGFFAALPWGFLDGLAVKSLLTNVGDVGSIPVSVRSPGGGCSNSLQYSCLGNPVSRGAWCATICNLDRPEILLGVLQDQNQFLKII